MLKIPQAIKNQFKTDGVLKNVRIVFPNGEREDICNDRLIKESLKFDESISSREEIRFGLCESSTLSFECIDVGNIKGMEIAAYIEVDATGITFDIAPTATHEPVIICATPDGETEEKIFVIFDFPELAVNETYSSQDNVDITWIGEQLSESDPITVNTYQISHTPKLSQYRRITGVDPRGTSENTYDGFPGGGYLRTYVYSVTTEKFYPVQRVDFSFDQDIMPYTVALEDGFESESFLTAINNIYLHEEEYVYPVETQTSSDVPFPFYRVPLGLFIVDECKRDAKMRMRKVTAYSRTSSLPAYDWWTILDWPVTSQPLESKTLDFNVMNFILSSNRGMFEISEDAETELSGWQLYRYLIANQNVFERERQFTSASSGNTYRITFSLGSEGAWGIAFETSDYAKKPWGSLSRLLRLDKYDLSASYQSSLNDLVTYLRNNQITEDDVIADICAYVDWYSHFNPVNMYVCDYFFLSNAFQESVENKGRPLKVGDMFMNPRYLIVFKGIHVSASSGSDTFVRFLDDIDDVTISEVSLDYNSHTIPVDPEITAIDDSEPITWARYSFLQTVMFLDMRNLLEGCVELKGCFGRMNRYGYFQFLSLYHAVIHGLFPNPNLFPADSLFPMDADSMTEDTNYMAVIDEDEMISLWYEEYFIAYGGITCTYLSSEVLDENNNPVAITYENVWENDSRMLMYDVSNNAIIRGGIYTAAQITALLTPLVTALQGLKFYPSDISCVGLPYIEAGDWALASMYGNKVLNLCLSRTLDGIQGMRDRMVSD